ncbi:MAG TPA: GNAT family N-acetyltransferase [Thermotogota bacterium]|nr:GNAT family N-acetyltransferase [Thermotogota bacterium]HPJ89394.1 GNAT family N-acetyltransferase [Thermotogota bacterium]HPR96582.1 GNAT family N-acetyltransferase [Thermotogota bacterium]
MEIKKGDYLLTDDKNVIDMDFVVDGLHNTYWADKRERDIIEKSIEHSIFLSLFKNERQIGFTRIVTDYATFAWIADVYIDPEQRGNNLGKFLVENTVNHEAIKDLRLRLLKTRDAHGLYEKYGFVKDECMVKRQQS